MASSEPALTAAGYAFGPFVVDTTRQVVWREGRHVPLTGKSFEVLSLLLASRERVVTKDEMLQRIWPDTFVQENNLARHVSTLRRALGQRPDQNDYILTVQGRGYRFVAPVTALDVLPSELIARPVDSAPHTAATAPAPAAATTPVEAAPTPILPPVVDLPGRLSWQAIALGVGATGALAALAVFAIRGSAVAPPAAAPQVLHQLTYGPSTQLTPSWSPDGQSLVYASDRTGNFDLFVQRNDGSEPVRLTMSAGQEWQPAWSPDGKRIAFRSEGPGGTGLYVVAPGGGAVQQVSPFGFAPRWSPDSTQLLFVSSQLNRPRPKAYVVGLDGAPPRPVRPDMAQGVSSPAFAWHPDGRRISVSGLTRDGQWTFVTGSVDGKDVVTSTIPVSVQSIAQTLDLRLGRFVWAPSGRRLFFEGQSHEAANIWRVDVEPNTLGWVGSLERVTTGPGADRNLSLSADGHRLAFETVAERTRIWSFPLAAATGMVAGAGYPVTPGAGGEFDVAVSQDGKRMVYRTTIDGRQELWQLSLADGQSRRLLSDPASFRSMPRWSPDGASLTYLISARPGDAGHAARRPGLAILSTAGGPERILPAANTSELIPDDWSSDGRSILGACRLQDTGLSGICLVPTSSDGPPTLLASDPKRTLRNARFSPDQTWITFTAVSMGAGSTGTSTVYVRRTTGGPMIALTDGQAFEDKAHWAPDGRTVYFVSNRGGLLNVWGRRIDAATGQPVGEVFRATQLDGLRQGLATDLNVVDVALASGRLFVPITERSGQIWALQDAPH